MFKRSLIFSLALAACVPGAVETGVDPSGGCHASPDCPEGFFCVAGACQTQAANCQAQRDCTLPDVCLGGHCLAGCAVTGCDPGQVCAQSTGLCGDAPDGGDGADAGGDAGLPDGTPDAGGIGPPPPALVNGTFESGFSGWTAIGQTSLSSTAHSGSSAAMAGGNTAGDAAVEQQVTVPQNALLSFWYQSVCNFIVDSDWGTVVVKSTSGAVLATPLSHTCNKAGWKQVNADLSALAGQTVVLSFENHFDGYPGDLTYTLYDDVTLGSGGAAPDFSLSANPSSASGAASVSIGSAPLAGFSGSIALSVSGAPAGSTVSLSSTSLSAGSSAALTLTPGSAAAGTYPVTVTGTSGALSHSAQVSWTIASAAQPDFSISASPSSASGAASVSIGSAPLNGFSGSITLSVTGAPAGASASLSGTSISAGSGATLSLTPGSAAGGTYTVLVTGSSGALSHAASVVWTIAAVAQPNFSLSASPGSVSGAGSSTITLTPQNGFSSAVALSVSGAPSGATASLSAASLTGSGSSTLSLNPGTGASGTYTLTVTGVSGALSHSASVSWTIAAAACTADTWSNYAHSFMTTNCTYCHSQYGTYSNVKSNSSSISSRINSGNMPQDHSLSSSDKQRILKWLSCGLPQ